MKIMKGIFETSLTSFILFYGFYYLKINSAKPRFNFLLLFNKDKIAYKTGGSILCLENRIWRSVDSVLQKYLTKTKNLMKKKIN